MNNSKHNLGTETVFSVIMPCYNSEKYVDAAIRSCLDQSFKQWELIIINDGSNDGTMDIVNSYPDRRIHVYSKENGGYISAVNYGLDFVNGIYFLLLGSDDELLPSLFEEIFSSIQLKGFPDMIGFRTTVVKQNGTMVHDEYSSFCRTTFKGNSNIRDYSKEYPKESEIFFTRDTSKIYKYETLGGLRYFGKNGVDADGIFSMLFAHKSSSFLSVPLIGYVWHLRDDSLSGRHLSYETQIDRIYNWFLFGQEIEKLDVSVVVEQEKWYLVDYLYQIQRDIFLNYKKEEGKNAIILKCHKIIRRYTELLSYKCSSWEIKLYIQNLFIWELYSKSKLYKDRAWTNIRKSKPWKLIKKTQKRIKKRIKRKKVIANE